MAINKYKKIDDDPILQYPPKEIEDTLDEHIFPMLPSHDVEVYVERVEGMCPYIQIEGDMSFYSAYSADNIEICPTAQWEFWQYMGAITAGVPAKDLGIATDGEDGFVQCGAWGCPTCEAKVVYRLHPVENPMNSIDKGYTYTAGGQHHSAPKYYRDKYFTEETAQQREDLIKEWDEAGRPNWWDKWSDCSQLKQKQLKWREEGLDQNEQWIKINGVTTRNIRDDKKEK